VCGSVWCRMVWHGMVWLVSSQVKSAKFFGGKFVLEKHKICIYFLKYKNVSPLIEKRERKRKLELSG
jgi:hypothetical protein